MTVHWMKLIKFFFYFRREKEIRAHCQFLQFISLSRKWIKVCSHISDHDYFIL